MTHHPYSSLKKVLLALLLLPLTACIDDTQKAAETTLTSGDPAFESPYQTTSQERMKNEMLLRYDLYGEEWVDEVEPGGILYPFLGEFPISATLSSFTNEGLINYNEDKFGYEYKGVATVRRGNTEWKYQFVNIFVNHEGVLHHNDLLYSGAISSLPAVNGKFAFEYADVDNTIYFDNASAVIGGYGNYTGLEEAELSLDFYEKTAIAGSIVSKEDSTFKAIFNARN